MKLRTLKIFQTVAICFTIISLTFHVLTYFPHLRTSNSLITFFLGVAIFPPFAFAAKLSEKTAKKGDPMGFWQEALKKTPRYLVVLLILTIPYVCFNFVYSLFYLAEGLTPDEVNGVYVLMSKGRVIREVSEAEYFEYIAYNFRGISGHFILFQLISTAIISSAIKIHKGESLTIH